MGLLARHFNTPLLRHPGWSGVVVRATGAGGSRAARYINLINTNTQSRRALFNTGDNPPPFNSRSRSKITECQILSGWVKQSHGGGGAEGLKYTFREHIYPKPLLLKGAMTKQMCVPGWASQLHSFTNSRGGQNFSPRALAPRPESWGYLLFQILHDMTVKICFNESGSQPTGWASPLLLGLPVSSEHGGWRSQDLKPDKRLRVKCWLNRWGVRCQRT